MRVNWLTDIRGMMVRGITIGIVCVLITSCGLKGWGESLEEKSAEEAAEEAFGEGLDLSEPDTEIEAEEDGEQEEDLSKPASDGSDLISGPSVPCPTTSKSYNLWYDHTCVIHMAYGTDEIYLAETSEIYPFALIINEDGTVYSEAGNQTTLTMKGWAKTDSDTCSIVHYLGTYPLRAEISGECKDGLVHLKVKLERVEFNLQGDCELMIPFTIPGTSSAPEIDHFFVHRELGDAYILDVPPGGSLAGVPDMLNCTYLFVLEPGSLVAPDELELIPLPPPDQ